MNSCVWTFDVAVIRPAISIGKGFLVSFHCLQLLHRFNLYCPGLSRYYKVNEIPLPPGVDEYSWLAILGIIVLVVAAVAILLIAINARARHHVLTEGQQLYLQSQSLYERYQKERLQWERERLARMDPDIKDP